ncbi:hypothetical protein D9M72_379720 [compost metagenome]
MRRAVRLRGARRAHRAHHRRLRLARALGALPRPAHRRRRAGAHLRPRPLPVRPAAQPAAAHAPQAGGGGRRRGLRRRHQLLRRPDAGLRRDGQAGLRGGTARTDRRAHPRVHGAHGGHRQQRRLTPFGRRHRRRAVRGPRRQGLARRHREDLPGGHSHRTLARVHRQRLLLSGLPALSRPVPRGRARRGGQAVPAGHARHEVGALCRAPALRPPAARGRRGA